MTLPSSTTSTAGSVTLEPTSPASVSTVRTSSTDAFSCLPPQRTIAYTEELSLCLCGPNALFRGLADHRHEEGLASLAPGTLGTQPWNRPVRWHLRLSDPGGRRGLGRRLPVGAHRRIRRARLPGGGPPPASAAGRLTRRAVPGRLSGSVLAAVMTGPRTWLARGGGIPATGGCSIAEAGRDGAGR